MRCMLLYLFFAFLVSCQTSQENQNQQLLSTENTDNLEVLLLGTFHFNNYNPENNGDLVESEIPDVLTLENQLELEEIANQIIKFGPNKIFVEYDFKEQKQLDSIYTAFPEKANFKEVRRNELYQIAFRVAKQLKHAKVFAMDIRTEFDYNSLVKAMQDAQQFDLIKKDEQELDMLEINANKLFNSNATLVEMLFYFNEDEYRRSDINWYVNLANQGGKIDDFSGTHLASEWYKRNLNMYSVIQKSVTESDEKIMILAGASHISMFKEFIDYNPEWKTVELKDILK